MREDVIEILTEELSMENFLRVILPRILPEGYLLDTNCFIRPHEGKSHLKKSIPKKIKAYPRFGYPVKVIIIHDQDSNDCKLLKQELVALTQPTSVPVLVRIACKELENWFLGDLDAVEKVFPKSKSSTLKGRSRYTNPDIVFGADELKNLCGEFSKTFISKEIPKYMDIDMNRSKSFNCFLSGLRNFLA